MSFRDFHAGIIAEPKTKPITNRWAFFVIALMVVFPGGFFLLMGLFPEVYEYASLGIIIFFMFFFVFAWYKERAKKKQQNPRQDIIGSFAWQQDTITISRNTDTKGAMEFALGEITYVNFYPELRSRGSAMSTALSGKCIVRCDLCVGKTHQRFHLFTEENNYISLGEKCSEWNSRGYKVNWIPE